jgi:hypothetical protein
MYLLSRFLIDVQKKDSDPTTNSAGKPRTLAALALSRICCKIGGRGLSAKPGKILLLAGFGSDGTNWQKAKELRAEKKSKAWLLEAEGDDGMAEFEDARVKGLDAVAKLGFGDKNAWRALDAL